MPDNSCLYICKETGSVFFRGPLDEFTREGGVVLIKTDAAFQRICKGA